MTPSHASFVSALRHWVIAQGPTWGEAPIAWTLPWSIPQMTAGILLDGRSYRMAGTTRDREIAQPEVLEGLGWKVTRVWAIDWWEDSDAVVDGVRRFLEQILGEMGEPVPVPGIVSASRESESASASVPVSASAEVPVPAAPEFESEPEVGAKPEPERTPEAGLEPESELVIKSAPKSILEPAHESVVAEREPTPVSEDAELPKIAATGHAESYSVVLAPEDSEAAEVASASAPLVTDQTEIAGRCRPYRLAQLEPPSPDADFLALDKSEVAAVVDAILQVEAPIEEEFLYRRIARHYGVRMGSRIRTKCEESVKAAHGRRVTQAGRTIVWLRGQDPKSYVTYRVPQGEGERRSFDELPLEEIAAAALEFIENNGPSEQEDLVRGVLHELEFSRLTAAAREYLQKGLTFGIRRGLYKRNKSTYSLLDEGE